MLEIMKKVTENIKIQQIKTNIKTTEMASILGISRQAMNSKLSNRTSWSLLDIYRLKNAFECTLDDLIG